MANWPWIDTLEILIEDTFHYTWFWKHVCAKIVFHIGLNMQIVVSDTIRTLIYFTTEFSPNGSFITMWIRSFYYWSTNWYCIQQGFLSWRYCSPPCCSLVSIWASSKPFTKIYIWSWAQIDFQKDLHLIIMKTQLLGRV